MCPAGRGPGWFSCSAIFLLFLEFCLFPRAPRTAHCLGLCAEISLTGVSFLLEAQGEDLLLLSLLCHLETWKRQERAWAAGG